jgi:hypothetical protein
LTEGIGRRDPQMQNAPDVTATGCVGPFPVIGSQPGIYPDQFLWPLVFFGRHAPFA